MDEQNPQLNPHNDPPTPEIVQPDEVLNAAPVVNTVPPSLRHQDEDVHLTWEASEYISHHKPPAWYAIFGLGVVVLGGLLFLVTKDILSVVVVMLMAVAVLVYAVRQPHTLQYSISESSLIVGHKEYTYDQFKSFSIMQDNGLYSVNFTPTKRFAPGLSIYFDQKDAEIIMDLLSRHLPHEEKDPDPIEKISRFLRF